jgi:dCTP deaminase
MILSDESILRLVNEGRLVIKPLDLNDVKSAHVDLHLSSKLIRYVSQRIDLRQTTSFETEELEMPEQGFELKPGDFYIGSTLERVSIPNGLWGFIETKGNIARAGIQSHNTDGHIDPGFNGTITLEIKNNANHSIIIYPGMAFVQIHFFQATSVSLRPYAGKYQNQQQGTVYIKD